MWLSSPREGELTRRIDTLETTRAGAIDEQETELRRIERDLHDGAQARLVALGMSLGMAEHTLAEDPQRAGELLAEARVGAEEALKELRDLARGIHPPVLSDRGLEAAITALASSTPLPVSVSVSLPGRLPPVVESAAYFVVAEALANAGKYAGADQVTIVVRQRRRPARARGVRRRSRRRRPRGRRAAGLRRRVEALDGQLDVFSPPGGPTDDPRGAAVRVVIAEDLALLRDGLTRLLRDNGIEVVAAVRDGDSLVREVVEHEPDLAVVDIRLPPEFRDEGLRAALELRRRVPATAILVVSQYVEETYAGELLAGGAEGVGYLLKDRIMHVADFLEAVRRVADGGTALDPDVVAQLFRARREDAPLARLTPREREVLGADGRGAVERGDRGDARVDGRRRREARPEHHVQAGASSGPERPPPRARGARVSAPGRVRRAAPQGTTSWKRPTVANFPGWPRPLGLYWAATTSYRGPSPPLSPPTPEEWATNTRPE